MGAGGEAPSVFSAFPRERGGILSCQFVLKVGVATAKLALVPARTCK